MSTHYDVQALPAEQREHILRGFGLGWWRQLGQVAIVFGVVLLACWYVGLLDATTLLNGLPSIATLAGEAMPPDFSGYRSWIRPLIDTLAMSIAGTAIAVVFSLVVAFVAARNTAPHPLVFGVARVLLNALRLFEKIDEQRFVDRVLSKFAVDLHSIVPKLAQRSGAHSLQARILLHHDEGT